jgi:hypothetical protein
VLSRLFYAARPSGMHGRRADKSVARLEACDLRRGVEVCEFLICELKINREEGLGLGE